MLTFLRSTSGVSLVPVPWAFTQRGSVAMPDHDPGERKFSLKKGDTVVVRTADGYMSEGIVLAIFSLQHGTKIRVRCDHRVVMVDANQIVEVKD
jgi:hypothetical protein